MGLFVILLSNFLFSYNVFRTVEFEVMGPCMQPCTSGSLELDNLVTVSLSSVINLGHFYSGGTQM